jgi:CBS domain containing-hemolysin-like protein
MALAALVEVSGVLAQSDTMQIAGLELTETTVTIAGAVAILFLIFGSGFFSSSEIAMFSLPAHQVDAMVEQGKRGAEIVASLKEDPHRLLVTILVGNNLVNITMSSISTTIVGIYFDAGTAVVVSSFGITSIVLLFGESAPKSYAVDNTELWARTVAPLLRLVGTVLWPLVTVFYYLTKGVNRIIGGSSAIESSYVSREEIRNMIRTGEREDILDEEEREMLDRTLSFTGTTAKEVMTPRLDVIGISTDATVETAVEKCLSAGYTRMPVYRGSLDDVVGVFDLRELGGQDVDSFADTPVEEAVVETLYVPESKNVDDLLEEMRERRLQVAVVVDEFGATEGLVTTEDLTEEIVGEILAGDEEHPIEHVDDDTVRVSGSVRVEQVNDALDVVLPEGEEFETIAGFIFNRAGRLVEQGETFDYENVTLRAEQVDDTRIQRARVTVDRGDTDTTDGESPVPEADPDD